MCFCTPRISATNCGSTECEELAQSAEVLGLERPVLKIDTDQRLEIPAFLRREREPAMTASTTEAPEETRGQGEPVAVLLQKPEASETHENSPPDEVPADDGFITADEAAPTLESVAETVRKLRKKRDEIDETIRLLKIQGKKMWDRL